MQYLTRMRKTFLKNLLSPRIYSTSCVLQTNALTNILPTSRLEYNKKIKGPHGHYETEYQKSITNPEEFWYEASKKLHWFKPPAQDSILKKHNDHFYSWFPNAEINICFNMLDVHIANKKGNDIAIYYDSPVTNSKQAITFNELHSQVSSLSKALVEEYSIQKGDVVVIYMPMIPQAIVAMLACARIGAIHSVVFGGFASRELASRIKDCNPSLVISASCGKESNERIVEYKPLLDEALQMSKYNKKCLIYQRSNIKNCQLKKGRDDDFQDIFLKYSNQLHDAISLKSTDYNYILYTSGTTGSPKGVIRDTGGHATALKWSMDAFYNNSNSNQVFWAASDLGWVVGHSYIVYGPLLQGCPTVLYEGKPVGTPDASSFWRVIQEYKVSTLFTAPTAFRAIKQVDPNADFIKGYDITSLQALFLAGERSDPKTLHWCEEVLQRQAKHDVPAIDHWWQTELGWPGAGNALGLGRFPTKYGACAAPVCGHDFKVFNEQNEVVPPNTLGNLCVKLPLPPGALPTLYNNDERYIQGYLMDHPGYYTTGDEGIIDSEGYVHVMGRSDDVICTAGHRLSTGTMEEILLEHPLVADCAVFAVNDEIKGEVPIGFITTVKGCPVKNNSTIEEECIQRVKDHLGPIASFKKCKVVTALPKTRSGKILRGTMRKIANGQEYKITPTIEDATIFDTLAPQIVDLVNK